MEFGKRLEECESFACIFRLVKSAVEETLERRRDGLMLALQYLPENLGAYYGLGSNFIVMNKALLERVRDAYDTKATKSYVFSVLLHEYLHSLGYLDESLVRAMTYRICREVLGEEHLSTKISFHGLGAFVPRPDPYRRLAKEPEEIEVLESFDTETVTYIG